MTNESRDRAAELLDQAVRLLGILVTKGLPAPGATQTDHIMLLASAGIQQRDIAKLLDINPNTVSARLSERNKKQPSAKKAGGK